MKKIFFSFCVLFAGSASYAQTVPNGGMETWRLNDSSGTIARREMQAPMDWYGIDSIVIFAAQYFLHDTNLSQQVFEESTPAHVHGGSYSAKVVTKFQDTLANFPGYLTNASGALNASIFSGGGASSLNFSGGTAVTQKITSVSAYVQYFPGIDTTTHLMGGVDFATLGVTAFAYRSGVDTFYQVGLGAAVINASDTFFKVTANIVYADSVDSVALIQIFFGSSGGAVTHTYNLDSSTLYVDDVTMVGVPEPRPSAVYLLTENNAVKVYPNPTTGILFIENSQNTELTAKLYSVTGQDVMDKRLTGNTTMDISSLPAGFYLYTISDIYGNTVQRGKVVLN